MFISGSWDGWNQCSYKLKAQVLQLNSEGYFKRRRRLLHKGFSPMRQFFYTEAPVTTQAEIGLSKILYLWGKTIDMSDQTIFTLKDSGIHDEEVK